MPLAPNATLADVFGKVAATNTQAYQRALTYVRNTRKNMERLRAEHGEVVVRIGITGIGENPLYRIDHAKLGSLIEAFDGSWGQPWRDADGQRYTGQFHAQNWSTRSMTYEEVDTLYTKLLAKVARL